MDDWSLFVPFLLVRTTSGKQHNPFGQKIQSLRADDTNRFGQVRYGRLTLVSTFSARTKRMIAARFAMNPDQTQTLNEYFVFLGLHKGSRKKSSHTKKCKKYSF